MLDSVATTVGGGRVLARRAMEGEVMQDQEAFPTSSHWPRTAALLLLPGGRFVTLGRGDVLLAVGVVEAVSAGVVPARLAAWLVAAEWRSPRGVPRLRRLRRVVEGEGDWAEAAAAFIAQWTARTQVAPRALCRPAPVRRRAVRNGRASDQPQTAPSNLPPYLRPP